MPKIILNGVEYYKSTISGGGSGGHTIYDEDGTALTQENGLQFTGAVSVSDDSVNGRTVVDIESGASAVHYSTSEQVIGTWIDDKPLYQITFTGTWSSYQASVLADVSSLSIDSCPTVKITAKGNTGSQISQYYASNADRLRTWIENNKIYIESGSSYPVRPYTYWITLEYTKTTD